jgi:acyl-CoA thioesterase I
MSDPLFRYVALGDSTAVGVGANDDGGYPARVFRSLKAFGVPAGFYNLGLSGATSRDVAKVVTERVVSMRPSLVTLGIGTNDLWRMISMDEFASNLQTIADVLEKAHCDVFCCTLPDVAFAPVAQLAEEWVGIPVEVLSAQIDAMNVHVHDLKGRRGFHLVDLDPFSRVELAAHPEYFSDDGIHPSAAGYDRLGEWVWAAVRPLADSWKQQQGISHAPRQSIGSSPTAGAHPL